MIGLTRPVSLGSRGALTVSPRVGRLAQQVDAREGVVVVKRLIALVTISGMTLLGAVAATAPAQAKVLGPNGQIAFGRGDSEIFIADPDGTHENQLPLPYPGFIPVSSPDGKELLVSVFSPGLPVRPLTIDPDGSNPTLLVVPEAPADMDLVCRAWSPDGSRLLCQGQIFEGDHSLDGIYTLRASDGGDLTRLTTNPFPPTGEFGGATSRATTRPMERSSSSSGRSREPIRPLATSAVPCSWRTPTAPAFIGSFRSD